MTEKARARFHDGALHPVEPLNLAEGQEVLVTIQVVSPEESPPAGSTSKVAGPAPETAVIPSGASVTPLELKLARLDAADAPAEWYSRARRILRGGDGGEHGLLLYKLGRLCAGHSEPPVALDVGTARGFSAMSLARAFIDAGVEGQVYTIDVLDHHEPRTWHVGKQGDDELDGAPPMSRRDIWQRWFAEESAAVSPVTGRSLEVLRAWPHGPIDVAFLDGSHAYADVKGELVLLDSLMAGRGAIVMDDFHLGVAAARFRSRPLNLAAHGIGRTLGSAWRTARNMAPRLGEDNEFTVLKQRYAGIRRAVSEFIEEQEGRWLLETVSMPSRGEYQGNDYALAVLTRSPVTFQPPLPSAG